LQVFSLAIAIPPIILEATGFITREANGGVPFINQAESALRGIRLYSGLIPGIAFLIGAAILFLYPIRGAYKQELEEKILALHEEKED
jgi:Na+/melibiose symporter-like transporter